MKVDRQEIAGVVTAFDDWFTTNHEERLLACEAKMEAVQRSLQDLPGVKTAIGASRLPARPSTLRITIDTQELGITAPEIAKELMGGDPSIWLGARGDDTLGVNGNELVEGDEEFLIAGLRRALSPRN